MMKGSESAKKYNEVTKAFVNMNPLYGLLSLPAGDGNYESYLKSATLEDLSTAVSVMSAFPDGNKSRLAVCERQLQKLMA